MTEISWRDFRENLADVINRVRQGERITITRHKKPWVVIEPPSAESVGLVFPSDCAEKRGEIALLADLIAAGYKARKQVPAGKGRCDIVVFDADNMPRTVIELKQEILTDRERLRAFEQVTRYARILRATGCIVAADYMRDGFYGEYRGVRFCRTDEVMAIMSGTERETG